MKTPQTTFLIIVLILIFGGVWRGAAQEIVPSQPQIMTLQIGEQNYELEQVLSPPLNATFYSLQRPDWPPFPINPLGDSVGVFSMGNIFFYDDTAYDYTAEKAQRSFSMLSSEGGPPSPGEGGGGGEGTNNFLAAYSYTTNDLWLEITAVTNGSAYFTVHTPNTNVVDLFTTTNLTTNVSGLNLTNWMWLLRTTPGNTNIIVTNLWPVEGWFRLGTMQDTDGDGLTDAYEQLVSHTSPTNADTDGDGISDYWELMLGTNPNYNESAQSSSRLNYTYGADGWLRTLSGAKSKSLILDNEANVLQITP